MPDPPPPGLPARGGRAAGVNTPNRFEPLHLEPDTEPGEEGFEGRVPTQYLVDASRSILAENDSPDVVFRYSLNPYRAATATATRGPATSTSGSRRASTSRRRSWSRSRPRSC